MAGIYNRDNFAQGMQNALNNAYNRRAATQRERAERVNEIVNAGGDFAKVLGRTVEEWDVPDQYKDNPDYRAARFDYILGGDRSGLDAFRQAEMQAEQARKQQEFTAAENALNRKLQASEGDKNREIQRQQNAHSKIMDKAKLLRDYNTYNDIINDIDTNKSAYKDKWQVERAKAVNDRDMQKQLMKSSGLFTPEELGEKPAGPVQIPFRVGYVPEATPATAQEAAPAETPKPTYADWMKQEPLIVSAIKGRDWANAEKLIGELDPNDLGLQKDVGKYRDQITAGRKADQDARAAAAKAKAKLDTARQFVQNGGLTTTQVRNALGMTGKGGGKTEATIPGTWTYNGKEENVVYTVKRDGLTAYISVDDTPVGTVGLGYGSN